MGEGQGLGRPHERALGVGTGWQGREGGGGEEGKRCGGRGEGAVGLVAVAAQAHLGGRWEGARGLARAHPRGRGEKSESTRCLLVAGFASSPLPYPQAVPATTSGPAPILSANGQRHPKTEVQKPFRLETGSPIRSRESRGWRGSWSSELPEVATLGRGFRYGQSGHGICWGQQGAELMDQWGWRPGTGPGS